MGKHSIGEMNENGGKLVEFYDIENKGNHKTKRTAQNRVKGERQAELCF